MNDEADAWFYDMRALGAVVERNDLRQRRTTKRIVVLGAFVLSAFVLLAWRSEINADRITAAQARVGATQAAACASGLEILRKSNAQLDALIATERANPDVEIREARIKAYRDGRIEPLPICAAR